MSLPLLQMLILKLILQLLKEKRRKALMMETTRWIKKRREME